VPNDELGGAGRVNTVLVVILHEVSFNLKLSGNEVYYTIF